MTEHLTEWIERLQEELERLRAAVRLHYEQRGDSRCHLDDLKLYHDALGIAPDPYVTALPPDEDMEESCRRYRRQRQCPTVAGTYPMPGGMTISQLESEVERLRAERDAVLLALGRQSVAIAVTKFDIMESVVSGTKSPLKRTDAELLEIGRYAVGLINEMNGEATMEAP
jgi:uncharacterized small protein (DUF1192 family)